jgi:hypothetical protein
MGVRNWPLFTKGMFTQKVTFCCTTSLWCSESILNAYDFCRATTFLSPERKPFLCQQVRFRNQGCQMAYFLTKNPNLGKFWRVLQFKMSAIWSILRPFGIFCGHLIYFIFIWYAFPVLVCCATKNLATLFRIRLRIVEMSALCCHDFTFIFFVFLAGWMRLILANFKLKSEVHWYVSNLPICIWSIYICVYPEQGDQMFVRKIRPTASKLPKM